MWHARYIKTTNKNQGKNEKILNLATKKQTPFFSVCHLINCVDSYKLVKDFPLI